ncbi:hypothetical protein RGR602_PC01816 (plasmid) [Rhizobium gallicum bv. gallicum R602sp]|uniref:Uncharacterized protein n=1 Tax=Rhizobium gallicum bv. gallicum R602sp TaxID=1041138 RepID=A0A0B4XGF9_9HYPH|nr:hypothetical protein RGR602_PC01816 [Rhizobium gallicum bv. gallicum R602sp]
MGPAISEIPTPIDALRPGAMSDKEPAADTLHFLIARALDEAIAKPRRRDLAMPREAAPD